jgi:hypothetical protein
MKLLLNVLLAALLVPSLRAANSGLTESKATQESKVEPAKGAVAASVIIPKSVFETSSVHKDPFNPRSTRRRAKVEQADKHETPPPVEKLSDYLVLQGLSGSTSQRLAIINGRTMAEGEDSEVSTERGKVKVRCLEIRSNAVIVAVGAEATVAELKRKD